MRNFQKLLLGLALAGLGSSAVYASAYRVDIEDEAVAEASVPEVVDPNLVVDKMITEYLNKGKGKEIRKQMKESNGWIGYATAEVSVSPENPDWAKFRRNAYDKAVADIEAQYIKMQYQSIKAENVKELFANAAGEVPDFSYEDAGDPSKFGQILDKLLAVTEGKLDKELDELGVDKEQFARAPESQRHVMLSESLVKSTMVESMGSISGLIPVQTFEGFNEQKEHVIGVVCVVSPKLKQFAYDVLHRRGQIAPTDRAGEDLYELFSADDALLIDQFGVRKMIDEDGYPVLISFGQWSNSSRSENQTLVRKYRMAAKKQAEAQALNQLAMFLNGKTMVQSQSDMGELFEEAYKVHPDNYKEQDMVNSIIDTFHEKSRDVSKVNVSGLVPLYSWTVKHPDYGHEIVGVIMMWSPKTEKAARESREWKPGRTPSSSGSVPAQEEQNGRNGSKTGEDYMDLDDF
ncbi:MAG: hypothetical protein JW739_05880 [Opitutales bacterium]|nr:hypothetical protein [Opitutales bacterium]